MTICSKYFNNCPVVYVTGRTFPIEVHYIDAVNKLVAQGQAMQRNKASSSTSSSSSSNIIRNDVKVEDKKKKNRVLSMSGMDKHVIDQKPSKFDADLTAELIIRIITMFSSLQEKSNSSSSNGSSRSAALINPSSKCGDAILVFLSGVQAIEKVNRALRQRSIIQSMKVQVDC